MCIRDSFLSSYRNCKWQYYKLTRHYLLDILTEARMHENVILRRNANWPDWFTKVVVLFIVTEIRHRAGFICDAGRLGLPIMGNCEACPNERRVYSSQETEDLEALWIQCSNVYWPAKSQVSGRMMSTQTRFLVFNSSSVVSMSTFMR